MRYRKIEKWDNPKESIQLLYFAQIFDELFFYFSLDTYKPSAMNTSLLCLEALEVIHEIEKGTIKEPNLQHVIDELCESIKRDTIAQSLMSIDLSQVSCTLLDPKKNKNDKKVIIEIILSQLNLREYKEKTEEILTECIVNKNPNLNQIRFLARSYATTLLNIGFSAEFISGSTKKFFHYGSNRISDNKAIIDFIKIFSEKPESYTVIFKCSKSISLYENAARSVSFKLAESISDFNANIKENHFDVPPISVALRFRVQG